MNRHYAETIAIDARTVRPDATGVGRSTMWLIEAMARIAPNRRFVLLTTDSERLGQLCNEPNVEPAIVPWEPEDHPKADLWLNRKLKPLLRSVGAQLFHSPAFIAPLRRPATPITVTIHDLSVFGPAEWNPKRFRRYMKGMIQAGVSRAACVFAPSETVRKEILRRFKLAPERVVVAPNAPRPGLAPPAAEDVDRLRKSLRLDKPYVVGLGTLEPRKNPVAAANALAMIALEDRPVLVWAGGNGHGSRRLQAEMTRVLGTELRRFNAINDEDLRNLIAGAQAFIWPSFDEGFGMPVLEAMTVGTPVICSDIPVHREVAGNAALFADPNDPEALSRRIVEIANPDARRIRVWQGFEQARRFSWDSTARIYLNAFAEIVGRHNP